jgi:hypothetical protein
MLPIFGDGAWIGVVFLTAVLRVRQARQLLERKSREFLDIRVLRNRSQLSLYSFFCVYSYSSPLTGYTSLLFSKMEIQVCEG